MDEPARVFGRLLARRRLFDDIVEIEDQVFGHGLPHFPHMSLEKGSSSIFIFIAINSRSNGPECPTQIEGFHGACPRDNIGVWLFMLFDGHGRADNIHKIAAELRRAVTGGHPDAN
jgi:hypothetical protein